MIPFLTSIQTGWSQWYNNRQRLDIHKKKNNTKNIIQTDTDSGGALKNMLDGWGLLDGDRCHDQPRLKIPNISTKVKVDADWESWKIVFFHVFQ